MNKDLNNNVQNQDSLETLESLEETNVEQPKNYDQQVNELINSVTMADLVDPNAKNKKSKKGLAIAIVSAICFISLVFIVLLSTGTLSKLGPTTTSELDVFKTEKTANTSVSGKDLGKYTRELNAYTLDTSNAENGKTITYYLTTQVTVYITYADDYDTSHKFTVNVNGSSYVIEQDQMGDLVVSISTEYIVYSNSKIEEQIVLSKNGLKIEEDPQVEPEVIEEVTTTTTTRATTIKTFNFSNTTDANGRTTTVIEVYYKDSDYLDYSWIDEDGYVHDVYIGSEESRLHHPELYTTQPN